MLQKRKVSLDVLNGQEVFRLKQAIESGGDIYEFDSGSKGLVVGPQSDLATYRINYYDDQASDKIGESVLSLDNPILGRVDALLDREYPTAQIPGNILISPVDFIDPDWKPSGWRNFVNGLTPYDSLVCYPPLQVDLVSHLRDPQIVAPRRDDKVYRFSSFGVGSVVTAWYFFPFYGRRFFEFLFTNLSAAETYTFDFYGVALAPGIQGATAQDPGETKAIQTPLFSGVGVAPGATHRRVMTADTEGMFDLMIFSVTSGSGLADDGSSLRVTVSDRVQ